MYRKNFKEMDQRIGSKTIDRLAEIPVVNTALTNVSDYYGIFKQRNMLLRTSCNLAELSLKTMAFAATPIKTICKKPIETMDSFISEKVDALESAFPVLSKPTEVLTNQAKDVYDRKVKQPIEQFYQAKEKQLDELKQYGSNKVLSVVKVGTDSLDNLKDVVDKVLENRFAKILTDPVLNFTEKSLDYWLPIEHGTNQYIDNQRTLRRIYDINNRVYKHLYQSTFNQLNRLHLEFENTIKRLKMIKQIFEIGFIDRLTSTCQKTINSSLVRQCMNIIQSNNLSLEKMESLAKGYYNIILTDVTQLLEKYMTLVKNFPVNFNGTKLRKTIENIRNQFDKDSFSGYITLTIDNLMIIHQALLNYTQQMFHIFNDSRLAQLLKRIQSQMILKQINKKKQQLQATMISTTSTSNLTTTPYISNEIMEIENENSVSSNNNNNDNLPISSSFLINIANNSTKLTPSLIVDNQNKQIITKFDVELDGEIKIKEYINEENDENEIINRINNLNKNLEKYVDTIERSFDKIEATHRNNNQKTNNEEKHNNKYQEVVENENNISTTEVEQDSSIVETSSNNQTSSSNNDDDDLKEEEKDENKDEDECGNVQNSNDNSRTESFNSTETESE